MNAHDGSFFQPLDLSTVEITRFQGLKNSDIVSWVEKEESKAIQYLLALRSIRNTIAPVIHGLPDEVILRIITFLKETHRLVSTRSHFESKSLFDFQFSSGWISATQVCRRWRVIGLTTPTLWTNIGWKNPIRTFSYLSRSGNSPLFVVLEDDIFCGPNPLRFVEVLIPHVSRIAVLDVCLSIDNLRTLATLFSASLFQNLTFLGLRVDGDGLDPLCAHISITAPVTHVIQDLKLQDVCIPWDSHIYKGLKTLSLKYNDTEDCVPSMETFLDVLEANPELTTLIIHNAGPRGKTTTSPQSSTVRQVKLDHLTKFELSLGNRAIKQLLGHLSMPFTTYVSLGYSLHDIYRANAAHGGGDYTADLPSDQNWLECLSSINHITVTLKDEDEDTVYYGVIGKIEARKCFDIHFEGSNRLDVAGLDFQSSIGSVFQSSPITSLKLSIQKITSPDEDWSSLFQYFRTVTHLELSFPSLRVGGQRFYTFWRTFGFPDSSRDFIFPHVTSLKFYGSGMDEELGQEIRLCLLERLQNGLPNLRTLELHGIIWDGLDEVPWPRVEDLVDEYSHSLLDWSVGYRTHDD